MSRMCASYRRSRPRTPCRKYCRTFRRVSWRADAARCAPPTGAAGMALAVALRMSRVTKRLRMAVVGQGHFAQAAVLPAIEQLDDIELTALVSGSDHKLDELGERYGVRTLSHYDELDRLLSMGTIDAVYIAVPNDLHAEMTLIAARNGVHVLCEKPMAPTEAECMQMIRACEQRRVKLMIAYRLHF